MPINEISLSDYGKISSAPSPVNRMTASFASEFRDGIDINLGVGYVNESTIPSRSIQAALHKILGMPAKYRLPFNYGSPAGSHNLIASVKRFLSEGCDNGLSREVLDSKKVIIGPSGATSLLEGIGRVLKPGLVVTSDPMYYIFCEYLERQGFDFLAIPEDDNGIRTDVLKTRLNEIGGQTKDITFFYVVTVGNPSCTILSNERRRQLLDIASGLSVTIGRKIPVFFDRAYEDLVHDPEVGPLHSLLPHDTLGILYEIGTLSKILAPALRIGYMVGNDSPFIDAMIQKSSDTGFSAPMVTQEIASCMLDGDIECQIDFVKKEYRRKAVAVREWIDAYLGSEISSCSGGKAGFYYYLTFRDVETSDGSPFFRYLSRITGDPAVDGPANKRFPRVIFLPGCYCVHSKGEIKDLGARQIRLSYGFEGLDRIKSALKMMGEAVKWAKDPTPPEDAMPPDA